MWVKKFITFILFFSTFVFADTAPPVKFNTFQLAFNTASEVFTYSHFSVIGVCTWLDTSPLGIPYVMVTPELDEYLPDLWVMVFNDQNDNPWDLANNTYDSIAGTIGNKLSNLATGDSLGNGQVEISNDAQEKSNGLITKYVDVVGDPLMLATSPLPTLPINTMPFMPYYSAEMDWPGRFGLAEKIQPETYNPFGGIVGNSFIDKWGYEYPREMTLAVQNDYIASVLSALHSADLVTNNSPLHIVQTVSDSCGINCSVANVIPETSDNNEIWQEIYPNNEHIQLGQSQLLLLPGQSLGSTDENAGNGNYVFAVWRHYRGCMPNVGKLLWASIMVPSTSKSGV